MGESTDYDDFSGKYHGAGAEGSLRGHNSGRPGKDRDCTLLPGGTENWQKKEEKKRRLLDKPRGEGIKYF